MSIVTDDKDLLILADVYARYSALNVVPQAIIKTIFNICKHKKSLHLQHILILLVLVYAFWLIFGFYTFKGLGFIGSPLAGFVSTVFQASGLYAYAFLFKGYHRPTWFAWSTDFLDKELVTRFITLSLTMFANLALDEWAYNVVAMIAGALGSINLAANRFSLPIQVRIANSLGANKPYHAKRTLLVGFTLGATASIITVILVLGCGRSMVHVFTQDDHVVQVILSILPTFCLAVAFSSFRVFLSTVIKAMSLGTTLVVISGIGSWVFLLPFSYLFDIYWHCGLSGLVVGQCAKFLLISFALYRLNWVDITSQISKAVAPEEEEEASLMKALDNLHSPIATSQPTFV
ncbi:Multidrug/Oligosaccharidyl-lipid/Polysaccharide (MOP) Flippase Superfamily [Thraustotheca clavata]|uniref:Multidrug/Oligosaccharidyl-lipid/Polysaccharide (MOP) Flippase Superfamily n=1 Tax=Thraustotheca clavata TaxID=74557 RepID=A0A1V9ZBU7_9STRA|nr:Multidrug/Oligosaccharidyl-lipid/Polysaccharide (MOP) Flippase Superfamily [Thraustotheca clavata]